MKKAKLSALLVLAAFAALPALAGTRNCTNALVTAGICRSTSDVVYTLSIPTTDPDGAGPLLAPSTLIVSAFTTLFNYQSPSACTADMVAAGVCSSGQLGQPVSLTQAQFTDFQIRTYVMQVVRQYRVQQAVASAQSSAAGTADPDVGQ